jgi:hypothetical protein
LEPELDSSVPAETPALAGWVEAEEEEVKVEPSEPVGAGLEVTDESDGLVIIAPVPVETGALVDDSLSLITESAVVRLYQGPAWARPGRMARRMATE